MEREEKKLFTCKYLNPITLSMEPQSTHTHVRAQGNIADIVLLT